MRLYFANIRSYHGSYSRGWNAEIHRAPEYYLLLPILNLAQGIPLILLFIQINRNATAIVKRYSRFSLAGTLIMVGGPLATVTGVYLFIPGIYTICLGIGVLLIVWGLFREPRQAYVLPFKLLRLLVFKWESGLPLYSHTWRAGTNLSDEDLFSAMIQGVTMLMKESIKQGELRTIELERAVLLVRREISRGIACVLVSTKKSRLLQESLQKFLNLFAQRFSNARPELIDQDLYRDAKGLILQCFPFVPE